MMKSICRRWFFRLSAVGLIGVLPHVAVAQVPLVTAGANLNIDFNQELDVPFSGFAGHWFVDVDLDHDPNAGPMIKIFKSPFTDTGAPILLDAQQPFALPIDEKFHLLPPLPGGLPQSVEVRDWHEEILTPGFVWVIPNDTSIPQIFPPGTSLITKNGVPHPWEFIPAVALPNRIDVKFPPILPGETLDIHKALQWIGTPGNRIWGDNVLDDGSTFDESGIRVWEYPTVPEPGAWALLAVAVIAVAVQRRR
ncbi:MAG: hypothetical protein KDA44_14165 [Planctomycetales bacterium]|nr:hypothetical protein [Planctomycetales bacterium]